MFCGVLCVMTEIVEMFGYFHLFLLQGRSKSSKNLDFVMSILFGVVQMVFTLLFHYFSFFYGNCDSGYSDWYSNCTTNAYFGISLFLVTTEFIVALTAAIFTCLVACSGASGFSENSQRGNMVCSI